MSLYLRGAPVFLAAALTLAGCAGPQLAGSGPSSSEITAAPQTDPRIQVIDLTPEVAHRVQAVHGLPRFSDALTRLAPAAHVIGKGDLVEVSIWEAAPAALLGANALDGGSSRSVTLPPQMVTGDGEITVPFAGRIPAAGKPAKQVEKTILGALQGKANQPQVLVRVAQNATFDVTVVGEVAHSLRMPLTARGERLLDAVAAAGGVKDPTGKVSLQVSRAGETQTVPLARIIQDPAQNIVLQPGDVVTALAKSFSFAALGATGRNEEINFETTGMNLAQALARAGGVLDTRADASGVFLFRHEDRRGLPGGMLAAAEPRVPVIYRVNLRDPAAFLVMQAFPVSDKDVLYVSNAPLADLQKFMGVVSSLLYPAASLSNTAR